MGRAGSEKNNDPKFPDILKRCDAAEDRCGCGCPTYPQFRDMNQMFLGIINDESAQEEPLVCPKGYGKDN